MTTAEITEGARVEIVEADFAASTGDSFLMTLAYGMGLGTKGTVVALPEGLDDEQKKVVRDLGLVAFKIDGDPEDEIGLPVKRSALAVLTD